MAIIKPLKSLTLKNDSGEDTTYVVASAPAIVETTEPADVASFSDGAAGIPVKSLIADINPVQTGSGDPSPSNVRPITGWTGMNVTRTGKNTFSVDALTGKTIYRANIQKMGGNVNSFYLGGAQGANDNMQLVVNSWAYCALHTGIKVTADTPAVISCKIKNYTADCNGYVRLRANTTNTRVGATTLGETYFNATGTTDISVSGTVPSGNYIILEFSPASKSNNVTLTQYAEVTECQLEIGTSTATTYEPYNGTTYPISWQDEAGTVYGGTLDVTTGLLTVTHGMIDMNTVTMQGGSAGTGWVWYYTLTNPATVPNSQIAHIISEEFPAIRYNGVANTPNTIAIRDTGVLYVNNGSNTTQPTTKAVYELATPQTYQLTPQAVMTILGQNNIWADTGDVEVAYTADTKMYIDKMISEL